MTVFAVSSLVLLRWVVLIALAIGALSIDTSSVGSAADVTTRPANPIEPEAGGTFEPMAVVVDPHGDPLAAYQVEIRTGSNDATLVGVEGGETAAFAAPPYYDPRALQSGRIILAGFNTGAILPNSPTRVATIMVHLNAGTHPAYTAKLIVAGDHDGKPINATVSVQPLTSNEATSHTSTSTLYPGAQQ